MKKLYFDYVELISLNFYKVVFKPIVCDDYFCDTITNLIRQSILAYTPGFAVTEISVEGANSPYGYIQGIKEDFLNLILNIKGLVFKLRKKKAFFNISSSSEVVKGKDIILDKSSKIINPEHIICHINKGFFLNINIKVEKGKGFIPNSNKEFRNTKDFTNGVLIDAYFCPILKASYIIKKMNTSFYNNLKKIIFFIETNGTITVKRAIIGSLNSFLKSFSNFNLKNKKNSYYPLFDNDEHSLFFSILDAGFSFKTVKILNSINILNLNDLVKWSKKDLLSIFNINLSTIKEIEEILKNHKLSLFKI